MEKKPPLNMTPFDLMVTTEFLQTMKLMIPYLPPDLQRMAGIYAKLSELQNAIYYFQPPYYDSRRRRLRQKKLDIHSLMEDLRPYLTREACDMFDQVEQAVEMMQMIQSVNMEEMMQSAGMSDMADMMGMMNAFQTERKDSNGRMDEQSCNEKTRSGEAGTDPDCGDADSGEKRESVGSGDDDTDYRGE
ncbi:MAG: hypothetical protein ACI4F1_09220 [Bariatricus sp.]